MGTLYQDPSSLPTDLKVTIENSSILFPSKQSERKSIFLSNIDQVLNFDVQTVHFFSAHKDFSPQDVSEKVKTTLEELLVHYEFLAGRLTTNSETGRLEIDCNGAGIGFTVASSEFRLDELGDLVYPNPGFGQLICTSNLDILKDGDHPLCIVQITSFKCGGFAMGVMTNHLTFDGISVKMFLQNLASLASNKPLSVIPFNDRRLLAARSPPRVTFPHHELLKLQTLTNNHDSLSNPPPVFDFTPEELDFKILRLTSEDIENLKEKAKSIDGMSNINARRVTSFNAITSHIWRCKALSNECENNLERSSTILYAVDIRPRLNPPLPQSYTGNAVLTAHATARCEELERGSFSKLVEMVGEGSRRITDEYARSAIDWGELYGGFPNGEVLVSSWWRLGFAKVEYPWGKPRYSCPVVNQRKDIILLFPDVDDDHDGKGSDEHGGSVNVLVSLPSKEMDKFQSLFHEFLAI